MSQARTDKKHRFEEIDTLTSLLILTESLRDSQHGFELGLLVHLATIHKYI